MTDEVKHTADALLKGAESDGDSVRVSPDVIGVVAAMAASEVEGIAGMTGGIVGGIAEKMGRKDLTKGFKVHLQEEDAVKIDLNVTVDVGVKIVETTTRLRDKIRSSVESITGVKVTAINVHVMAINMPKEAEEKVHTEEE
jgi:uncharacterized alkaline shock family protein YloU